MFGEKGVSMDQLPPWVGGTADPNSGLSFSLSLSLSLSLSVSLSLCHTHLGAGMMREYASRGSPAFPPFDPLEDRYNSQMIGAAGKESGSQGTEEEAEDEELVDSDDTRLGGSAAASATDARTDGRMMRSAVASDTSKKETVLPGWGRATMSFVQNYGVVLTASSIGLVIVQRLYASCFSIAEATS